MMASSKNVDHATRLHVWQVVAPPHVDQVDFWNAVLYHVPWQVTLKTALFILETPLFPRAVKLLARAATERWKVLFTFSEGDRLKAWKALVSRGAPPSVEVIVIDHVVPSMMSPETMIQLEITSPRLETIIFRTSRELPLFSSMKSHSSRANDATLAGNEIPSHDLHHGVIMLRPRKRQNLEHPSGAIFTSRGSI